MEELDEKKENNEQIKERILGKKSTENNLFNIVSFLLNNNKNNFEEKLKPKDLELNIVTSSRISKIDKLKYKIDISYSSFTPKRDTINNIEKYKDFPNSIEIKDEYYKIKNDFEKVSIDLIPSMNKNMILDLSLFPFCYYNTDKKEIEPYSIKLIKNKFTLILYISHFNEENINEIKRITEGLNFIDKMYDYFENIYFIFEANSEEQIKKNESLIKIINNNNNTDDKQRIKYIFNILSIYDSKNKINRIINIFKSNKFGQEYFFILDQNNKIISIKKNFSNVIKKISIFALKIKNSLDKQNINLNDIFKEKEIKKEKSNNSIREIIYFFSKIKNLDYLFDLQFELSFSAYLNDECSNIYIKKVNSIFLEGEFRTKEYLYLKNLLESIKLSKPNNSYSLKEIETIDIDIDFTDMKCKNCSKIIPEDKHLYYCYFCKTKYCYECIHEQLKKKGKEKYIDKEHNLIFFKTRNKKQFTCLDKKKLGNNIFAKSTNDNQFDNRHNAICNGCRDRFDNMARYVCIHCRPGLYLSGGYIDYCQKCIEKMCTNENEKENLERNSDEEIYSTSSNFTKGHTIDTNHKHDEHIYLLLPLQFNATDEYKYNYY